MPISSFTSTKSTPSSGPSKADMKPLYQVKLLSALRSGDPSLIHPFLNEISRDKRKSTDGDLDTGAAALHLAIRCGSVETIRLLLSHRAISPNGIHPTSSGTTALHLAASLGRVDVVNLLLEQDGINDALQDDHGRTCREVAKEKGVIRAIDDSREFLNASYRSLLHSYIMSPPSSQPSPTLLGLLESSRVRFVDLSYLDDDSGTSLLHEAAKRKDLRLIELAVRAGADVFIRDRRGKVAYEGAGKDDRVRVFLRQFANHDATLIETTFAEPLMLKGYLNKYTNVAKGYNTRWFVLRDGVLSYYRHQEDETIASRGSISMRSALLKIPSGRSDKIHFEVHSTPSKGHTSIQKWYLKANHPVEAARWAQAIGKSIEWYKREGNSSGPSGTEGDVERNTRSGVQCAVSKVPSNASKRSSQESERPHGHSHTPSPSIGADSLLSFTGVRSKVSAPSIESMGRSLSGRSLKKTISKDRSAPRDSHLEGFAGSHLLDSRDTDCGVVTDAESGAFVNDDLESVDDGTSSERSAEALPHEGSFELHGNAIAAQIELTEQLLYHVGTENAQGKELDAFKESHTLVQGMISEYMQMTKERENWYRHKLDAERQRQKVWEESLATVVQEGEILENELRMRSRRRGSRFFDTGFGSVDGVNTLKGRKMSYFAGKLGEDRDPSFFRGSVSRGSLLKTPVQSPGIVGLPEVPTPQTTQIGTAGTEDVFTSTSPEAGMDDTDDEDEFFDAIEANALPNLVVPEELRSPTHSVEESVISEELTMSLVGYQNLRARLEIIAERPPTSLWSVLKHSIGKDLTKISFPVFFNEPTSMLQRMAEDMEFSECLDAAAHHKDPHRRIAFVAAFAMSNYSSTIGRIAKPFNPMLGETFEYVRLDKNYRYFSEQVSHHPPISACWAEAPSWNYYGEIDAQNKFMGKSFEIRPTGVAHAELLLPQDWAPGHPEAPRISEYGRREGKVVEHYTWKKVTSAVSGFILGSPTIDHYGDMIITNHRTKDTCILTFKPRGWRGKDAYEISGRVMDSKGNTVLEIAGRWNSQLIVRDAGTWSGDLNPDMPVSDNSGLASPSSSPEYFLLWRNSEKPVGSPFNLTPFALTLNDCPKETLKPYLCPTDCRLRPDQRAFELGYYEPANTLKQEQEEMQRATRRAREKGEIPPHKPRWFRAETDSDSGERVWVPARVDGNLEYWQERQSVWREKQSGSKEAKWKAVDPIFINEPDFLR
ncbi:hypothetical protein E1B28_006055 [Marasmius oreades]|uniref:PH domain-containing protein n=1 Tax=Marasmius oreades TaxID=181124 RepID=A0A9P7UVG3_9AGAR|nr:uncharacterized protein E1B28_006055 [Marasmius oreades]KAG7095285.1 hypothetical protein E1B28_006055 [Marasmius oreades]